MSEPATEHPFPPADGGSTDADSVLESLLSLTEQLSAAGSRDDVAQIVATTVVRSLGASAGFVAVASDADDDLQMLSHVRAQAPGSVLCRLQADAHLPVVEAWRFGVPVLLRSAEELYRRYPALDRNRKDRASLAALPLEVDGMRLGAINLTFASEQPFDPAQRRALRVVASLCAQALRRAGLAAEVERMHTAFVVTASHELRSPLTAVYGAAVALSSNMAIPESARSEMMAVILSGSERMTRVIDELIQTAELDAGTLECRLERVDLRETLQDLTSFWQRRVDESHRVTIELDHDVPPVAADARRLQQVVSHLVDNACKYSPAGTRVRIVAAATAAGVELRVLDEGSGLDDRARTHAFDKFFRADPMQCNGVAGTGLGLYVSRRLVDAMGGRIWLERRQEPTRGLAACVELPAWAG